MKITGVSSGSPADAAGVLSGDDLLAVNGSSVRDDIDVLFYGSEDEIRLLLCRNGEEFEAVLDGYVDPGLSFEPMELMSCGNHCVFCFVDQNPQGMRGTIYFKDEDYRLSFLHGAYVTLTMLRDTDIDRILEQRLSPLYVSVHATDPVVRWKLLGLRRDDCLLEKIERLTGGGISLHTQIVVCPGINDGAVLEASIRELARHRPGIVSVAVVPVGLTGHREGLFPLHPVTPGLARDTIEIVDRLRTELRDDDSAFLYCSDEWYIRAGMEIPPAGYYDDFPQIENGVGMVRDFLDVTASLETVALPPRLTGPVTLVTGMSMAGYAGDFARRAAAHTGLDVRALPVENRFYGSSVTVSGLLTGGDIIRALDGADPGETVVLPPNCLNADGRFLDDLTPEDVARVRNVTVLRGSYEPLSIFFDFDTEGEGA